MAMINTKYQSNICHLQPAAHSRLLKGQPWTREELVKERALLLGTDRTKRSAIAAYDSWQEFVSKHGFHSKPTPTTVSDYILYQCAVMKPTKVISELNALETYLPEVREVRRSKVVQDIIAGCKIRYGESPESVTWYLKEKQKQPLTIDMINMVLECTDKSYDFHLFKTMLLVGFHGMIKLRALCEPSSGDCINRLSVERPTDHSFSFFLPKGNDNRKDGNLVIMRNVFPDLDILSVFNQYLRNRDSHFPWHFRLWLKEDGIVPDRSFFLTYLKSFNFALYTNGPSMRAGGATALAESGASSDSIQVLGRWSDKEWRRYLRKHPMIIHRMVEHDLRRAST